MRTINGMLPISGVNVSSRLYDRAFFLMKLSRRYSWLDSTSVTLGLLSGAQLVEAFIGSHDLGRLQYSPGLGSHIDGFLFFMLLPELRCREMKSLVGPRSLLRPAIFVES